jgi:5-methylthioadenosine/S-adenosylhomocysteine deaminase
MAGTPLPPRMTLPIKGGRAFPPNSDRNNPDRSDIAIAGSHIVDFVPDYEREAEVEIIKARDDLVLPGFVNAHYHSHDASAKGALEEVPLETWRLYPTLCVAPAPKPNVGSRARRRGQLTCFPLAAWVCQSLVFNLQVTSRQSFIRG